MTITLIYIIIFMNPGTGVRVLWHVHICHIVAMFVIYSHLRKPILLFAYSHLYHKNRTLG